MDSQENFLYLNRDGCWLDFQRQGLTLDDDGTLHLAFRPAHLGEQRPDLAGLSAPVGPAGVATATDGTLYWSDPDNNAINRLDACDTTRGPVPCLGGKGEHPTQFNAPRGIAIHSIRQALFVADSGNHRIQFFDLKTFQLLGIWGEHGSAPGQFNTPTSLACDAHGNVYVVDEGNRRVQKFNLRGQVDDTFWAQVAPSISQPSEVAVSADSDEVAVIDRATHRVYIFDLNGAYRRRIELIIPPPEPGVMPTAVDSMGLAANATAIYVGDNRRRRIYQYNADGTFGGEALDYAGPIAALALDGAGNLWVLPGGSTSPLALIVAGGYVRDGFAWGGPIQNPSVHREQWHWLRAIAGEVGTGSHLQMFVYRSLDRMAPAAGSPPWSNSFYDWEERVREPLDFAACLDQWMRLPLDATSSLFPGASSEYVWIGFELSGEGHSSPRITQLRIDFDHSLYSSHLPAAFREDARGRDFVARLLTLFEKGFDDAEQEIANLPALFDPAAVPAAYLDWLASWLALPLPGEWDEAHKRKAIAGAFEAYSRRGTVQGLRDTVREATGIEVEIVEPIIGAQWWALPAETEGPELANDRHLGLGFSTMLAPAEANPPVLGTTAVLDHAHLIGGDEKGVPLYEDVAHQFAVLMYRGKNYSAERERQVRAVIEREKPAHTAYQLCVVEPNLRVGFQSRLGVDTIIGSPPPPQCGLVLGGEPPGQIGLRSEIAQTTFLG